MKVALISDIHANLEALEAVLKDIEGREVDAVHCLGDVVGYGCSPCECLDLVNRVCDIRLQGNHESVLLNQLGDSCLNKVARDSMRWTKTHIADAELTLMAGFAMDARVESAYLVHASPHEPDRWHYILSQREAESGIEALPESIGFFGHTHLPYVHSLGSNGSYRAQVGHDFDPDPDNRYLVNVGSVGQPRDGDPRSCYVVYDSSDSEIRYYRVEYDITATQKKMVAAHSDRMLIDRLLVGR